jgi:LPS-assembly lipoprotein
MRAASARVYLLALALLPLLAACGFHLQGSAPLPHALASVRIDAVDTQSEFYFGLRNALRVAGAHLDDEHADANAAVIHILTDVSADKVLTVSALNVPTEYELTYTIRVSVYAGDRALMPAEEHLLVRDYAFDESQQLAKERERSILSDAMARDLVGVVMRRLSNL